MTTRGLLFSLTMAAALCSTLTALAATSITLTRPNGWKFYDPADTAAMGNYISTCQGSGGALTIVERGTDNGGPYAVLRYDGSATVPATPQNPATPSAPNFVPLQPTTGSSLDAVYTSGTLSDYINNLFKIALSVGAMLAVLRLVYAGYIRMISGVGSWASQGKAGEIINNAVFGLLLLLAVYLILYQINPCILNLSVLNSFTGGANSCP